jgi:hypothetical protein
MTPLSASIANATPAKRRMPSPWPMCVCSFVAGGTLVGVIVMGWLL